MRTVDRLLDFLNEMEGFSDLEREVLRYRINERPTNEEFDAARIRLAPKGDHNGWIDIIKAPKD